MRIHVPPPDYEAASAAVSRGIEFIRKTAGLGIPALKRITAECDIGKGDMCALAQAAQTDYREALRRYSVGDAVELGFFSGPGITSETLTAIWRSRVSIFQALKA